MPEMIAAPTGSMRLHVCRDGDARGSGWVDVYREAFPPGQRQDVEAIRAGVEAGTMELDETRDQDDRIACMTVTEVFDRVGPKFLLACYTATPAPLRSLGIGSLHRRRLVDLLKAEHPDHLGLFSEIESTRETGLAPQTILTRRRRLDFFLRLGVQRLPIDYRFPSFKPGAPALHGELLWVPFAAPALDRDTLRGVLTRIYTEGYGLDSADPFVVEALEAADRGRGESSGPP